TVVSIIGAVVDGISVLVAFLDQPFLRKFRAINSSPVKYIAPFLFTAVIGVFGAIFLIAMACFTPTAPAWIFVSTSLAGGLLGFWTVFSLIPGLDTLVQFVHLKIDALDIPDDSGLTPAMGESRFVRRPTNAPPIFMDGRGILYR
ncbi:hypothetical protein ACFWMS_28175, partial [Peribacillus butanolivorans]|uniref:hypothetical protein n=1 Tax=Peribacillus butanolivorans TaxID=421767 RepID=UPI003652DF70